MILNRFNTAQKSFCLGLVRLDSEYRLLDYNLAAKRLIDFPRRGSYVDKMLFDGKDSIAKLGLRTGNSRVISFLTDRGLLNTVAFRERSGNILLFFHPLLATLKLGNANKMFSKILNFYSGNILAILNEMGTPYGMGAYRCGSIPDKMYYCDRDVNKLYVAKRAISALVEKLGATNFKNHITISVDGAPYDNTVAINIEVVQFAIIELISALQIYGEGTDAHMRIGMIGDSMRIAAFDRVNRKLTRSDI